MKKITIIEIVDLSKNMSELRNKCKGFFEIIKTESFEEIKKMLIKTNDNQLKVVSLNTEYFEVDYISEVDYKTLLLSSLEDKDSMIYEKEELEGYELNEIIIEDFKLKPTNKNLQLYKIA